MIPITVDAIFSAHPLAGMQPRGFTWSPSGERLIYIVPSPSGGAPEIRVYALRGGVDRVLFHARTDVRGSRSRAIAQIVWSPDSRRIAYLNDGDLWVAEADGSHAVVLAKGADDPQWSPDAAHVAYVHDDDLYEARADGGPVTRLTFDGSPTRINGDPDWLYSEEMDVAHAYAWSPKGDAIAYLSFDESRVVPFPIQHYLPTQNVVEWQRYPLAGGANPRVSLRIVDLAGRRSRTLYDGAARDEYVVSFAWTRDGSGVVQEILDRPQRHLRLEYLASSGAAGQAIWRESDPTFVDVQGPPQPLPDGSFAVLSARDGVQALYRVWLDGRYRRLSGSTPIAAILRTGANRIYVSALAPTRRDLALGYVGVNGGRVHVVTHERGWHDVSMPQRGDAYVDDFSSFSHAPVTTIRRLQSSWTRRLFATPALAAYGLGTTRALEIPSRWGPLDAEITVPCGFNPHRRYPVIVTAYGGPLPVGDALPSADRRQGLFTFLLAQHGFLVFSIDGPASNVDRAANEHLFTERMGEIAMAGQLVGAHWLREQPYVDASRLGLFGWSYGGYLTAFTLTHAPGVFRSGIAGAPPADWRFYDTAYTERYMGTPQQHPAAYRATAVIPAAGRLASHLLVIQGSSDDNVHLMNSISLLEAFIRAGKDVEYALYPGARHGVTGIAAQRNLYTRMLDWWERTLKR
ncbi:MAG: DPP IV N-terminal domain-containing protein [Candidatus Tyrphobacter sp.]